MRPTIFSLGIRNQITLESAQYPKHLVKISRNKWPYTLKMLAPKLHSEWRSREFMVQVYREKNDMERISVNRVSFTPDGTNYMDGISWDELMRVKAECGRGDRWAVEIYPPDADVVNVANMRHLWVFAAGAEPEIGWKKDAE